MKSFLFGQTATGLPITAYRFSASVSSPATTSLATLSSSAATVSHDATSPETQVPNVFILGGVHGDEIEGVWAALGLLKAFNENFSYRLNLTLVPMLNLDGVLARERKNGNKVDLNRNMATNDWTNVVATERYFPGLAANSEPETRALIEFLEREKPKFILSLHSWHPVLNVNGDCRPEAEVLARHTGYRIDETIGYPTPGCLGTYAGLERAMPTLTYEIERGLSQDKVLAIHVPAILDALRVTEARFFQ
jgi:protein MpaA